VVYLINCGIGNVLSSPKATNPSIVMYSSDRPKIKNSIAENRLRRSISVDGVRLRLLSHETSKELDILGIRVPLPKREGTRRGPEVLRAHARTVSDTNVEQSKLVTMSCVTGM
jgi:hypothetical protein